MMLCKWATKEVDNFIKEKYKTLSAKEVVKELIKQFPELEGQINDDSIRSRVKSMKKRGIIESSYTKMDYYTPEQIEWLKANNYYYKRKELARLFNKKFKTNRTEYAIEVWTKENCDKRYYQEQVRYNEEEKKWLIENYHKYTYKALTEEFNKKFKKRKSVAALETFCQLKLKITRRIAYNTKIGYKHPCEKEIGHEIWNDGYWWIKVDNKPGAEKKNYIQKQRYIWEQYYGKKIPEGHRIIFLDGNVNNFDISNLACIDLSTQISVKSIQDCSANLKRLKITSFKLNKILSELSYE